MLVMYATIQWKELECRIIFFHCRPCLLDVDVNLRSLLKVPGHIQTDYEKLGENLGTPGQHPQIVFFFPLSLEVVTTVVDLRGTERAIETVLRQDFYHVNQPKRSTNIEQMSCRKVEGIITPQRSYHLLLLVFGQSFYQIVEPLLWKTWSYIFYIYIPWVIPTCYFSEQKQKITSILIPVVLPSGKAIVGQDCESQIAYFAHVS